MYVHFILICILHTKSVGKVYHRSYFSDMIPEDMARRKSGVRFFRT